MASRSTPAKNTAAKDTAAKKEAEAPKQEQLPQSILAHRTDLLDISAQFEGKLENAEGSIDSKVAEALQIRTGLHPQDVTFTKTTYAVTLRALRDGKPSDETYTGSSTTTVANAIENALGGKVLDYDREKVFVAADRKVEVPYFLVRLVQRSTEKKGRLARYRSDAISELRHAYGDRLKKEPDSIQYDVFRLRTEYQSDGALPKGRFENKVVAAHGRSDVSLEDAAAKANEGLGNRKVRCTVYQETAFMLVYGHAEQALRLKGGISLPVVTTTDNGATIVTNQKSGAGVKYEKRNEEQQRIPPQQSPSPASQSSRHYGRSGSPAARDMPQMPTMSGMM
ncbi:hypothetical protein HYS47_03970 [Candidatus Woesearchaeota archaeon]|nr:hypothetical protein [Candidatus Woesearchaeota archaeon]